MKESPREICNKKIIANNLASLAVAYETREKARNALLNINTPRSKKNKSSVEQFVGYTFEKLFEKQIGGKLIDKSGKNPDVIGIINGVKTFFEVKASRYGNCIVLKENQLNNFSQIPNCVYVLFYYSCNDPEKVFRKLGPKKFKDILKIRYVYILPTKIILDFYNQSSLKKRDKIIRTGEPATEIFIKLHRNTLEKYLVENIGKENLIRIGNTTYYGIDLNNYHYDLTF